MKDGIRDWFHLFFYISTDKKHIDMKQRLIFVSFIFFAFLVPTILSAQIRYHETLFDSIDIQTNTYIVKNGEQLKIDVYTPFEDNEESRPVILYVHGGGFSGGSRNGDDIVNFCKRLAGHGYVTASMSYRLTREGEPTGFGCDCPAEDKLRTFQSAVEDIQDATFFLIQNREHFGIDPYKIILAGSSAGAEAALLAAYTPPNCFDLESGPVSYAGVISMAGAIPYTDRIYEDSAIPTLFFHGTCDNLVPYASAPHHYCREGQPGYLVLHGAYTLSKRLEEFNVPYWLHTTCGGKHELSSLPMTKYFNEIIEFCHDFILSSNGEFRHTIIPGDAGVCNYQKFDFCNP